MNTPATIVAHIEFLIPTYDTNGDIIHYPGSDIQPKPWIAYQYHQSPSLKHGVVPGTWPNKTGEILDFSYVRTVLVVSALGIDSFLDWASNLVKVQ